MKIFKIYYEHLKYGLNFDSTKIAARTCEEALRKAKKDMSTVYRIQEIELLAESDQ